MSRNVLTSEMKFKQLMTAIPATEKIQKSYCPAPSISSSNGGTTYKIELPQASCLLPSTSNLQFDLTFDATTTNLKRGGVYSLIKTMRIMVNDKLIDHLQNLHIFQHFLIDTASTHNRYVNSGWGEGLRGDTINGSTSAGAKTYTYKIPVGLLSVNSLLPLFAMGKITIEIEFADPRDTLYSSVGGTPSYTITNLCYLGNYYDMNDEWNKAVYAALDGGRPISFQFPSYKSTPTSLPAGSNPTGSYKINTEVRQAKFLLFGMRDITNSSYTQDLVIDREAQTSSFQIKIGTDIIPSAPMRYGAESFDELRRLSNQTGLLKDEFSITDTQYNGTLSSTTASATTTGNVAGQAKKAWIGLNLEKWADQGVLSGTDLLNKQLSIELNCDAAVATSKMLHTFIVGDATFTLLDRYNSEFIM